MCWGDDGSKAAKEQQRQADAKNAAIEQASGQINGIFDNPARQQQIADYRDAVKQRGMTDLGTQYGDQSRNLKFAMARSGLTSGSSDVDLHDRMGQDYGKGVLQVIANANQAGSNLKNADEAARSRLLTQAATGYGLTDASQNALSSMQSNLQQAQAAIAPQSFADLFSNWQGIYDQSSAAQAQRDALRNGISGLFKPMSAGSGGYY
jgi:hypothetical protein